MGEGQIIPDELRFAVTRKCSGSCRHCYNLSGNSEDHLSGEDFISIIKEVHSINPTLDRVTLTGGEPMNEAAMVLKIAGFCRSNRIRVRLVTRGWELDKGICHKLKSSGVTRVQIGLDSSGYTGYDDGSGHKWDSVHSWLRCDESGFSKTVSAIKTAISSGLDISVRFSLCRSNLKDVVNTYRFVSHLGVSKFKFRVLFPDGRAKQSLVPELISGEELANAQYELIRASKESKTAVEVTQPCLFPLPSQNILSSGKHEFHAYKEACPCGTVAAYIDSNGDVKYCLFDEEIIGNVTVSPFLKIWNSFQAANARERRCPLDRSGYACSAFMSLYSQFRDYPLFIKDYNLAVNKIMSLAV